MAPSVVSISRVRVRPLLPERFLRPPLLSRHSCCFFFLTWTTSKSTIAVSFASLTCATAWAIVTDNATAAVQFQVRTLAAATSHGVVAGCHRARQLEVPPGAFFGVVLVPDLPRLLRGQARIPALPPRKHVARRAGLDAGCLMETPPLDTASFVAARRRRSPPGGLLRGLEL